MAYPVTVTGAGGANITINFQYLDYANLASSLLGSSTGADLITTAGASNTTGDTVGVGAPGYVSLYDGSSDPNQLILSGIGTNLSFTAPTGSGTVIAGGGVDTFSLGSGDWNLQTSMSGSSVLLGSGFDTVTMGGPDTIVASTGATEIFGVGTGGTIVGTSGGLEYIAGGDVSTTIDGGSGGATIFGNSGVDITYNGSGVGIFVAAAGNETLNAAGSSGFNAFFIGTGGLGSDSVTGGSGTDFMYVADGQNTLAGGAGANVFAFAAGTSSTDTITDFSSTDYLNFNGATIGGEGAVGSNYEFVLTDGTVITLDNVTSVDAGHIMG